MSVWKINGVLASELAVSGIRRHLVSQAQDAVQFSVGLQAMDTNVQWAYGQSLSITKDGERWFTGRVASIPRMAVPEQEALAVELAGPWWYFDHCVFQQEWAAQSGTRSKSRYILGISQAGVRMSNGAVIREAVQCAISAGAPIAIGVIDPEVMMPMEEGVDSTCGEIIKRMLRWSPDAVTWFDYSAEKPVFHCSRRENLPALELSAFDPDLSESLDLTARPDLQVPSVVINYETTETYSDGENGDLQFEKTVRDVYPPSSTGLEFGSLIATISLKGGRIAYISQRIKTRDLGDSDISSASWWQDRLPWLKGVSSLKIKSATREGTLPRELVEGQLQEWMQKQSAPDVVQALVDFKTKDNGTVDEVKDKPVAVRVTTTNAMSGTYRSISEYEQSEAVPVGLAQALYASTSQIHYQGSLSLKGSEVSGGMYIGKCLNLMGSRTEWRSMRALIQDVSEDVDGRQTTVRFGPAEHLGPGDLVDLLRANRLRKAASGTMVRMTGKTSDSGDATSIGGPIPVSEAHTGPGRYTRLVIVNGTKKIIIDPAALGEGQEIKAYEIELCTSAGRKRAKILMTEPY